MKCYKLKKFLSYLRNLFLPRKSVICKGPGFKIWVRPPRTSVVGRCIYLKGVWEPLVTKMAQNKIKKGWHIMDIGADIGYYSLLFASKTGSTGAIVSFEPDKEAWPYLQKNISMFEYSNIVPYNFALSDHYGNGMMKENGRGQLYPDQEGIDEHTSTVKMLPLDDFWPNLLWKRLDLIKIDVEGAELSIFKGMEKTIKKYHPYILLEIHPRQLKEVFNSSAEEVITLLTEKYSYHLTPIDAETLDIPQNGNLTVWCEWCDKRKKLKW